MSIKRIIKYYFIFYLHIIIDKNKPTIVYYSRLNYLINILYVYILIYKLFN